MRGASVSAFGGVHGGVTITGMIRASMKMVTTRAFPEVGGPYVDPDILNSFVYGDVLKFAVTLVFETP